MRWAPGWCGSRRAMKRVPSGQPSRSTNLVSSATWARSEGSPPARRAGCHAAVSKRLRSMAAVTSSFERAVMKNTTRRARQASAMRVEQPAASTRSCTCRRGRASSRSRWPAATASGSCAMAASSTSMWSAMLLAAALPGRSMIDSGSPCSVAHSIGWNPNPALKCAAAWALFSECTSTSVESMSRTTGSDRAVSPRLSHTPPRTDATTPSRSPTTPGPRPRSTRYRVESDATSPNSTGWARRCSMSLHASPPPASINNA